MADNTPRGVFRRAARRAVLVAAALLATAVAAVSEPAAAQEAGGGEAEVRIAARKLADGRVEFALQQRSGEAWGERMLPRARFFPSDAAAGRWLTSTPLTLAAAGPVAYTAIASGEYGSCALRADGAITCWGENGDGQADPPDGRYTAIAVGYRFSCAMGAYGEVVCWGSDSGGQASPAGGNDGSA